MHNREANVKNVGSGCARSVGIHIGMVERKGIEPSTSALRTQRSPS